MARERLKESYSVTKCGCEMCEQFRESDKVRESGAYPHTHTH